MLSNVQSVEAEVHTFKLASEWSSAVTVQAVQDVKTEMQEFKFALNWTSAGVSCAENSGCGSQVQACIRCDSVSCAGCGG